MLYSTGSRETYIWVGSSFICRKWDLNDHGCYKNDIMCNKIDLLMYALKLILYNKVS